MPERGQPRGVTPRPRSGAVAESARLRWCRKGREELPHVQGRGGGREDIPHTPKPEARGSGREELPHSPKPEARGSGREELPHTPKPKASGGGRQEQPHVQGAMAARAQEGLEELSHVEGQEEWW